MRHNPLTGEAMTPVGHVITTANSTYILDYREPMTLTRYPGVGLTPDWYETIAGVDLDALALRLDRREIPLLDVLMLEVGTPAVFLLQIVEGTTTMRSTSTVVRIEEIWA